MAEDNVKGFVKEWILVSIFAIGLLTFIMTFTTYQTGVDSWDDDAISTAADNLTANILSGQSATDSNLNLTTSYDPTISLLGDRNQVAQFTSIFGVVRSTFSSLRILIGGNFGDGGVIILSFAGILFVFLSGYYGIKWFKTGL